MQWLEVDRAGLGKLLARRGKQFVLHELIANAWDQDVSRVRVEIHKESGSRVATLSVEDDDPRGFRRLSDAFTLFAESEKKGDTQKRGRFNLGEKLVLALCDRAEIITTTGSLLFDADGRHTGRRKRPAGSLFIGSVRMTNAEFADCVQTVKRLICPPTIETTIVTAAGEQSLPSRTPIAQFEASLATEVADAEGVLRRGIRRTKVAIYEPMADEPAMLYEMGIPVVETGDRYHVDIGQKVPLNLDRDNVPPSFLRDVRVLVVNAVHERLTNSEEANAAWVRDALADKAIEPEAVKTIVNRRFGERALAYDPSDPEANKRAVAAGYTVVHGSQLSRAEWENVRQAAVLPAAGKVTPSPRPYSEDGPPVTIIPWADLPEAQQRVIHAFRRVAELLLGFEPQIRMVSTSNRFEAAYGQRCLDLNQLSLGREFFDACASNKQLSARALSLLIHELGHEFCGDHLSSKYYEALTDLGAKLALAVAQNTELLTV